MVNKTIGKFAYYEKNAIVVSQNINNDMRMSYVVAIFFLKSAMMYLFRHIFNPTQFLVVNVFLTAVIIVLVYTNFNLYFKYFYVFIAMEIFLASIFAISLIQGNAELESLMKMAFYLLFQYIPVAMYVSSIQNKKIFYNIFLKASCFMSIFLVMYAILSILNNNTANRYDMSFSYALALPLLFHLNECFSKKSSKKIYHLFIFLVDTIFIFLYGARGPILCIAVFFLLKILFSVSIRSRIILTILIAIVLAFVLPNFYYIGSVVLDYLDSIGYKSRTITLLFDNNMLHDSGRGKIWDHYLSNMNEKPILGWGLVGGWISAGLYPHNVIIEIFYSFGYFFGTILCIFLLLLFIKMFMQKNKVLRDLLFIFFSVSIPSLMVSGTFLGSINFWIFILLSVNNIKELSLQIFYKIKNLTKFNKKGIQNITINNSK